MAKKSKTSESALDAVVRRIYTPVDAASLGFFRIVYGLVVIQLVVFFWWTGRIDQTLIAPEFHFKYPFFGWVVNLPAPITYAAFVAMGIAGVFITLGLFYRIAATVFAVIWIYIFLIEQANYQNHFYMLCLVAVFAALMPLNRVYALDARFFPKPEVGTAPVWCLYLLRFQVGIVYFFGAVHKFNPDWQYGEPMRWMLWSRAPWFPGWGDFFFNEWVAQFFLWGGLLLDLLIVPLMLWRPTRIPMFLIAIGFHCTNFYLWDIDVFPFFMTGATTLFFDPDWPRRVIDRVRKVEAPAPVKPDGEVAVTPKRRVATIAMIVFVVLQFAIPWRPYALNPGHLMEQEDLLWFSWNMMLRTHNGEVQYVIRNNDTGEMRAVSARDYLMPRQTSMVWVKPDMIHQLAKHIADQEAAEGRENVSVFAQSVVSLNTRPRRVLVDPDVDLAATPRSLGPKPWVMPMIHRTPPNLEQLRDYFSSQWRYLNERDLLPYDFRFPTEEQKAAVEAWEQEHSSP